ncbi:MAG: crossover junction endodeoxyribonuclease RuvC [Terriglobia bacterium]
MHSTSKDSLRVLGIDCGSQATGYGIIESDGDKHQLVCAGVIRGLPKDSFSNKLLRIQQEIDTLLATHQPTALAVEDQFYLSNFKSVLKLGQVKGVVLVTAARAGVPVYEYSPLEIKGAVTGYGRADKFQVSQMVKRILCLGDVSLPHDASDALAVCICHLHTALTRQKTERRRSVHG